MTLDTGQLIGTWRRFGTAGPVYGVIAAGPSNQQATLRIRVLETGGEIGCSVAERLDGPRGR